MSLRYLFVDMNSFFASVEQQELPDLRGQPVGVVPVVAQTTCCIAASYEAKGQGVRTGTSVREARRRCPDIRLIEARPRLYIHYHHRIIEAIESCLHVDHVHSIDEMSGRLMGAECQPDRARDLADQVKLALWESVGRFVRCSIGIGPNIWLAKVATDIQKPDGQTLVRIEDLPQKLYTLKLDDLPGIGRRMLQRLNRAKITTIEQLCGLSQNKLSDLWQSRMMGELWWRQLRGEDIPLRPTIRRTIGHSRVLPPESRTPNEARAMAVCMLHKAAARLRHLRYWAGALTVGVSFLDRPSWHTHKHLPHCQDTSTMLRVFKELWERRPNGGKLLRVSVTLSDLLSDSCTTSLLFPGQQRLSRLSHTMDRLNTKFGPYAVYFASMHGAAQSTPTRIAFTQVPDLALPEA